jgi:hypothetical protein
MRYVLARTPAASDGRGSARLSGALSPARVRETAAAGVRDGGQVLPHRERIQHAFGRYDITHARAHTGHAATHAARAIGALAYTMGDDVAFGESPGLFTAAHEAAHVVQQRAGVELGDGVGAGGDRYERHADAVAARVIAGRPAEDLLSHVPAGGHGPAAPGAAVQREAVKKAKSGAADVALGTAVTATINVGLAKVDETLLAGARQIRLAIRNDAEFERAWDAYADRSGTPGARMEEGLNGFVDPTHPDGKTGFVRAVAGMGTAIHEGMHQRAADTFNAATVGRAVNEGTTELFTRVVIAYGGGNIPRAVYDKENLAMLRFQGISGLTALAQWYFKGDSSAVQKALGSKFRGFMDFMLADDPDSAIHML